MKHLPPAMAIADLLCDLIQDLEEDGVPSERTLEKRELLKARFQNVLRTGLDEGENATLPLQVTNGNF